ncbi:hypothetical protein CARUB_v10028374mg [Capsella rubella]|uniref:Prolamin-like domain-containing protein n=1 Tax=Capsella rubella TaxID=81985 RepID=R0ETQ5_9BRAS|nr:hypothetical protein CARUB_v10028374mg [Capsella rubella]
MLGLNKKVTAVVMMFWITLINLSCLNAETELFINPVDCLNSITKVGGCGDAIGGIHHWDFSHLKRACCEALEGLSEGCWPIIFPGQPLVHMMIKGICFFP